MSHNKKTERNIEIFSELLAYSKLSIKDAIDGTRLKRGAYTFVAKKHNVTRSRIRQIYSKQARIFRTYESRNK